MGEELTRILGFKNAPPCPPTQFLPLIHKDNHSNIKLQKHEFGKAWQRDLVVLIDGGKH